MDRSRSMIVWLLVFGLIGVLPEWIGASHAPGQAVEQSEPMKEYSGLKKLENSATETRKNIPHEEQHGREEQPSNGYAASPAAAQAGARAAAEAAERMATARQRLAEFLQMRQRQAPPQGRDGNLPPRREYVLSY